MYNQLVFFPKRFNHIFECSAMTEYCICRLIKVACILFKTYMYINSIFLINLQIKLKIWCRSYMSSNPSTININFLCMTGWDSRIPSI